MATIDDTALGSGGEGFEVLRPVGRRRITHAFHDIDGTHSLIRDWPPVMSLSIYWAMTCGLREDFDSPENAAALVRRVGREPLDETDRFCVESAGLSALTQMEYGIRRAVQLGNVPDDCGFALDEAGRAKNADIIRRIWEGEERFDDTAESRDLLAFISERTPRLFELYETVLNGACRDRNTEAARREPGKWRVPGSMEFLRLLRDAGCANHFVTGAVIYEDGGMFEEVRAVGIEVGPGMLVEALHGSSWDRKMPKEEVMRGLISALGIDPAEVLVVGDGRSEIKAGVEMGGVSMSRLPADAVRQRELHAGLGVNYILTDYTSLLLPAMIGRD